MTTVHERTSPRASRLTPDGVSAHVAQSVEHVLGKDEVTSSILVVGSKDVNRESGIVNRGGPGSVHGSSIHDSRSERE
jgi:hypothetical protein